MFSNLAQYLVKNFRETKENRVNNFYVGILQKSKQI